jgi:cyanophycinase
MLRAAFLLLLLIAAPAEAALKRYLTGNPADVNPPLHGPAFDLAGGGGDHQPSMQWVIDHVRGCTDCDTRIDVVVLRSSGADGYNPFIGAMNGVDSVETLVITDLLPSYDPAVVKSVRDAEMVFFAGGDQCNYVRVFNGTPVEEAVRAVHRRGGAVGGTSAGLAIQGEFVYDACNDASARSANALRDPYNDEISVTTDFFDWDLLYRTFTDTHFAHRDRMGRLMTFLARQLQETEASSALGIGVDQATALVVARDGTATVFGEGSVYLVLADHLPEVLQRGEPLTYCDFKIWRFPAGTSFSLARRPVTGYYTVSVNRGVLDRSPY